MIVRRNIRVEAFIDLIGEDMAEVKVTSVTTETVDWTGTLPAWPEFQKMWWCGAVDVSKAEDKLLYGKVIVVQLVQT